MENFLIVRSSTKVEVRDILLIYELYVKIHLPVIDLMRTQIGKAMNSKSSQGLTI